MSDWLCGKWFILHPGQQEYLYMLRQWIKQQIKQLLRWNSTRLDLGTHLLQQLLFDQSCVDPHQCWPHNVCVSKLPELYFIKKASYRAHTGWISPNTLGQPDSPWNSWWFSSSLSLSPEQHQFWALSLPRAWDKWPVCPRVGRPVYCVLYLSVQIYTGIGCVGSKTQVW